jgi:hypothetical protein
MRRNPSTCDGFCDRREKQQRSKRHKDPLSASMIATVGAGAAQTTTFKSPRRKDDAGSGKKEEFL